MCSNIQFYELLVLGAVTTSIFKVIIFLPNMLILWRKFRAEGEIFYGIDEERRNREFREIREFKDIRERCVNRVNRVDRVNRDNRVNRARVSLPYLPYLPYKFHLN